VSEGRGLRLSVYREQEGRKGVERLQRAVHAAVHVRCLVLRRPRLALKHACWYVVQATQVSLKEEEIHSLVNKAREIFMAQPVLLELEAPLKIVGDVHGQ